MIPLQGQAQTTGALEYYENVSLEDLQQVIRLRPLKLDTCRSFFRAPRLHYSYFKGRPFHRYARRVHER